MGETSFPPTRFEVAGLTFIISLLSDNELASFLYDLTMETFNVKKRSQIEKLNTHEYELHISEVRDIVSSTPAKGIDRINLQTVNVGFGTDA